MVIGIGVAFGWPWLIGPKPSRDATANAKIDFLTRGCMIVGVAVLCFALAVLGAILIVRQARVEYGEAQAQNLQTLIEGTQEDIRKKQDAGA